MKEGSTQAPIRHPLAWREADFLAADKIEAELTRVFDICHGCRRCFNLCDSFPRLFDLIDESRTGELDSVSPADYAPVVAACTLCDLCFMTKCPYVPPHEFDLDFPHLMLRARAAEFAAGRVGLWQRQLGRTDRNGRLAGALAPLVNWASTSGNGLTRPLMEGVVGIHREAEVPRFCARTLVAEAAGQPLEINRQAPAMGRQAVLFATCFVNYNNTASGQAARLVLAHNGVDAQVAHPGCCGMPQFEHGDLEAVAAQARRVAQALAPALDEGRDVVALTPSCALMLKFEWPLLLPDDAAVRRLCEASVDICQYLVDIAANEGLAPGLGALEGGVALHLACHARAQNMGPKAAEMLRLLPDTELSLIERCSGHGGSWGMMKENFEVAIKVGRPVARQAAEAGRQWLASECPLAGAHVVQGIGRLEAAGPGVPDRAYHPIELMARAWGLEGAAQP
ncbi:MAG TPA: heterodisulfide reductase-related iron-sulfur binding cluster [Alphaproteobacteria bacterium]|jgi:glycerol-3-phosphate dehydrogenase subunit C|nr:heterodisulfide reductase-related iron-sulfur binding cluster [Alphaproteobacteria bacterium]MDP6272044.1 heterodisulfide reductase-related iron-sulfur binding cluster [Alphaproteobacteria bacterium]MDP7164187.1 heterodisulfide reductase-related iron-sulfur binding cluster [Alphaproteobacteria bacterium]MDP7426749.1 heterodisulfide reductase-related iron-sulfur binding cluster [Alphaproteobacteria bacterium]HJM49971.1 heterodisulfide reductase-related iron-sulfur binding cluster [Alphaproteo